jgi:hypothetical protein
MIDRQERPFEAESGWSPEAYAIALGGDMLRVALDFDELVSKNLAFSDAFARLQRNPVRYNPRVMAALEKVVHDAVQADSAAAFSSRTPVLPLGDPLLQPSDQARF